MPKYDVIIVGAGMTGAWAAKHLTAAGAAVLVLDAGPAPKLGTDVTNETWSPHAEAPAPEQVARQPMQSRLGTYHRHNAHLFVDDVANPYEQAADAPFSWFRSRQVGGRGILWGRVCLRMSPFELDAASYDGVGQSWPVRYEELAPHYDEAESFFEVAGGDEGVEWLPAGHLAAATPLTPAEERVRATLKEHWPRRRMIHQRGIRLDRSKPLTEWPRFTPQGSALASAMATQKLEVRSGAVAAEIVLGPNGRARGVRVIDVATGNDEVVEARAVVVAGSTIESVRLLLMSRGPSGEQGLGSTSGVLGAGLMDHITSICIGKPTSASSGQGPEFGGPSGAYIARFQNLPGDRGDVVDPGFVRGYGVMVGSQRSPFLEEFILYAMGEMLWDAKNAITLSKTTRDAVGLPAVHVRCIGGENEVRMKAHQEAELRAIADRAGFDVGFMMPPWEPGRAMHECGGARMGTSRSSSVVDPRGRVWDAPNVVCVDGAVWPSCGYQNPTLTMLAFTGLASRQLIEDLRRA